MKQDINDYTPENVESVKEGKGCSIIVIVIMVIFISLVLLCSCEKEYTYFNPYDYCGYVIKEMKVKNGKLYMEFQKEETYQIIKKYFDSLYNFEYQIGDKINC